MNFELPSESTQHKEIAIELQRMADNDIDMRTKGLTENLWDDTMDARHTKRMKDIVAEMGWPSISKVGAKAAHGAWLLVQHADHDVDFQEQCLNLMKELPDGEVDVIYNLAYLEDRVRVNRGREQLYGTQFFQEDGKHIPQPIEDKENVDIRRATIGMGPLQEQIDMMYEQYPI